MDLSRRSLLLGTASAALFGPTIAGDIAVVSSKAASAQGAAGAPIVLGAAPAERALIIRMIRVMYPHARFGDGPYERTADAVFGAANKTPAQKMASADGLQSLADNGFAQLDDAAATEYLKSIEDSGFFGAGRCGSRSLQ